MYRGLIYIVLLISCSIITVSAQSVALSQTVTKELDRGYELYEAGSFRSAQAQFIKARELVTIDDRAERVRADYYIALCAGELGDANAMELFDNFLNSYPRTIYVNDLRFAKANLFYLKGEYAEALKEYLAVNSYGLKTSQQDEYNFKLGHSFFSEKDYINARTSFIQVGKNSEYGLHATYYNGYIHYINSEYVYAKNEFKKIENAPSYSEIIPFYLLQIEFLQGNYDYVVKNGDQLLKSARGEREAEVARIMGEAWFYEEAFDKTLSYMDRYREAGGYMGREEYYLVGYSQYMHNDIGDAIASLSLVVGADDQLTQNAAYHLGGCYLRMGDKSRAMHSFSMAATAPYDEEILEDALFNYGKLQYELGGGVFNEAINILRRYLDQYPDSDRVNEVREFLASAYYNSRNYEAAYEAIELIQNPDNNIRTAYQKIAYYRALEFYNLGDYGRAMELLVKADKNRFNPKYTALTQYWMGEIQFLEGKYSESAAKFSDYITLSPASEREHMMAIYGLAYSHFNKKDWSAANEWFSKFLSAYSGKDALRASALSRRADTYYVMRQFSNAMSDYSAAMAVGDVDSRSYAEFQRAMIQGITAGRSQKIQSLNVIINRGEGEYLGEAMYELGRTYMVMERFEDAANTLGSFINKFPLSDKYLAAISDLGLANQNMGNNTTALRYYKLLLSKAPASLEARGAMLAAKSIYVEMNDVDGYLAFARELGVETDIGVLERDSLSYAAAERVYMTSQDRTSVIFSQRSYLDKFPRGAYRSNALYRVAEQYIAEKQYDNAIASLRELSNMHYNEFSVRGLETLSSLLYDQKRYDEAIEAYRKLGSIAVKPETKSLAYSGYLKSARAYGDKGRLYEAASKIVGAKGLSPSLVREAKLTKALLAKEMGDKSEAMVLFKELATESQTAEGAEATFHVIEALYDDEDLDGAQSLTLKFAAENTPHSYWLGRAFITLGDIYIKKGDNFQARATLQSIIDGYSPMDDGVVVGAKERIRNLKD